jgi:hypothetical protein
MLLGPDGGADREVAPGVNAPFVVSIFAADRLWDGISVLSRWLEDAEDSLAESRCDDALMPARNC